MNLEVGGKWYDSGECWERARTWPGPNMRHMILDRTGMHHEMASVSQERASMSED